MRKRKGITLIELILTVALIAIVIQVAYSLLFVGTTSYSISTNKGFAQQDIRYTADFLEQELRYINDLSDTEYLSNEYFSLKINDEGQLVKSKHVYNENGTPLDLTDDTVDVVVEKTISDNWKVFSLKNTTSGVIEIVLNQDERVGYKESGYSLTFPIFTENALDMLSNVDIDLVNGDVLYFKDTKVSSLSHSIDLDISETSGDTDIIVTFYKNDGTTDVVDTITDKSGINKNFPTAPTRSGYTFIEWNTNSDGTGSKFTGTTFNMPSVNTSLYAIWVDSSSVLEKVTIDTSIGNDGIESIHSNPPSKSDDGRYYVELSNQGGSPVKIKLYGYTTEHHGKVTVTVSNSPIAIDDGGYITFTAEGTSNGGGEKYSVTVSIKTEGHSELHVVTYNFETKNL